MTTAKLKEEDIEKLRAKIGIERPVQIQWNEVATKDGIRHFVQGIGDINPLFRDEEYAKKTGWGCIIAPGCYLYSAGRGALGGLPGIHGLWAGDEWEWFQPIRVNDSVKATFSLAELSEKHGEFVGRMIKQVTETIYRNQRDEVIAICRMNIFRTERATARDTGKYKAAAKHRYTKEELEAIWADYDKEEIRGANSRYWEDVNVGDDMTHVVKGPLRVTDIVSWFMGWGCSQFTLPHKIGLEYLKLHPAAGVPDPETNVPDFPVRVHYDDWFAKQIGFPGAYDIGAQRISWFCHMMTNWMGDDAFLKKLDVQLRKPNIVGDTQWIRGKVADKYIKEGQYLVDCDLWADNQKGERTGLAKATVILPSKIGVKVAFPAPQR